MSTAQSQLSPANGAKIIFALIGIAILLALVGQTFWQRSAPSDPASRSPKGMVYIPGGSFMMGSADGFANEKPVHEVAVNAFHMDRYEVTVEQFKKFVEATNYQTDAEKEGWSSV